MLSRNGTDTLQRTNLLHRPYVQGIASYGIHRVGRINNQLSVPQHFKGLDHLTGIRAFRLNSNQHDFFPFYSLQRYHFLLVLQQQAYNIMKNRRAMLQNIIFSYLCVQLDEKIDSKTLQNGKNNQRNGFALS